MRKKDTERRNFSKEFKAGAPAEKREKPISRAADDLSVNERTPLRTRRARSEGGLPPTPGRGRLRNEELARLRKENKALREANKLLKKQPIFSQPHLRSVRTPVMVYQFMQEHKNQFNIRVMAKIFGVSSSAYYKWAK
jgi:transposase-like protein